MCDTADDCGLGGLPTESLTVSPDEIRSLPLTAEKTIPTECLDEFGFLSLPWHLDLLNHAMFRIFEVSGLTLDYMNENNAGSFALENHIRRFTEIECNQHVEVFTQFLGRSERCMHVMHYLLNETRQRIACTSEVVAIHVDMANRRASAFPQFIAERLDSMIAEHRALGMQPPVCGRMRA